MKPDLTEHNGRHRLRMHRRVAQREDAVWHALVEPELLSRWYPATVVDLEPHVGGTIQFSYSLSYPRGGSGEGDAALHTTGEVTEFREPAVFAFVELATEDMPREGDSLLRFEVRRDGTGSVLLFSQEFDDRPAAASYAAGWDACFDALEDVLEGRDPTQNRPRIPAIARHEMFVHLFGLDTPRVSATQLTVERQLMLQSPEKVWQILVPAGEPAIALLLPELVPTLVPDAVGTAQIVERVEGERVVVALADRSRVEWEISTGPGGARLIVTHGPLRSGDGAASAPLVGQWRDHIEALVEDIYAAHG